MSLFQVLDASSAPERAVWLRYWNTWPMRQIFAHPEYVGLFMGGNERALCAVLDSTEGKVIFPFLLRPLSSLNWFSGPYDVYDIVGPYGYGGAYTIGNPSSSLFWHKFEQWALQNRIVSVFTRLSLFPDQLIPFPGAIETKSQNVVRHLNLDPDAMWMDYDHKIRKNVKRARQKGLRVEIDLTGERLEDFLAIYYATMDRNNAAQQYYFDKFFFQKIVNHLPTQFAFFHVWDGSRIVSSELVLLSHNDIYSFLGGTYQDAYPSRPNDLLKHTIIEWGRTQGKRAFVLGGGYHDNDGIFRYKKSFAPNGVVPFRVGKHIYDPPLYEDLIKQRQNWEAAQHREWAPSLGFFPIYRS